MPRLETFMSCYRMRFSLPVLGDADTPWEIFQECVSRCDCQLDIDQAAASSCAAAPKLLWHQANLLHAAQFNAQ